LESSIFIRIRSFSQVSLSEKDGILDGDVSFIAAPKPHHGVARKILFSKWVFLAVA
jgi:hypothetical protein